MTLNEFLSHWSITENPFLGEEARADSVFVRMTGPGGLRSAGVTPAPVPPETLVFRPPAQPTGLFHSDFDKILGDLSHPSTGIVFGEKGSGKTAIRLQITSRVAQHNVDKPNTRILVVSYDDLNGVLARLHERVNGKTVLESFQQIRLVDHLDGLLLKVVPRLVDALLNQSSSDDPIDLGTESKRAIRRLDVHDRRDVLLLQSMYDRTDAAEFRTVELRRRLGLWASGSRIASIGALAASPLLILAVSLWAIAGKIPAGVSTKGLWITNGVIALVFAALAFKLFVWDRVRIGQLARRVRRSVRVSSRAASSYARSLRSLRRPSVESEPLPVSDSDEPRYAMIARLRRVLSRFGYAGLLVIVDRVDEPTLVSGDPDRMRAIVWPMLNNKFLQQDGVGVKLLLPIELRHALFKESSAFFQDARLDKQNLVERLTWTGPMLYDLCDARLQACRAESASAMSLLDMFAEDVTRQDLIDALDQMHQPRDAFKFLYRCLAEHAATVTRDQNAWKIPRYVLDSVRKQEVDRVQQLHRGIRPA